MALNKKAADSSGGLDSLALEAKEVTLDNL